MIRFTGRLAVVFMLLLVLAWAINFTKLVDCDFKADYKCEVVHGIGVIPAAAPITVWFSFDEGQP